MGWQGQTREDSAVSGARGTQVTDGLCALYYRAIPLVLLASIVNSAILSAYILHRVSVTLLGGWVLLQAMIVVARSTVWIAHRRCPHRYAPAAWYRLAVVGSNASGVAWGMAGWVFFSAGEPDSNIVLGFVLGGMGAGALAATTCCLAGFQGYLLLSIVPFAIRLATCDGAATQAMAAMCVFYTLFLMLLGRQAHASQRQALLIRFEHTALVEGLEQRIALRTHALQVANQRLSEDIAVRLRTEATLADYGKRQAAVAGFGQRALSGEAISTLFEDATWLVARQLNVAGVHLMEYCHRRQGLVIRAQADATGPLAATGAEPSQAVLPASRVSAAIFALKQNAAVVSEDLARESRFAVPDDLRTEAATGLAAVVIPGRHTPFGVLQVHDRTQRRFSADDVSFLLSIAATLAAAIERRRAEENIQRLALEDSLTKLPNRTSFRQQLLQRLTRVVPGGRMLALMLLDLDHFKDINDTLGHPIGDRLLSAVAERLRACGREGDAPARLGGDEFALILPDLADAGNAASIARRIIDSMAEPFLIEAQEIRLSVSIGITLCPRDGSDPDTLLRNADLALYRAKSEGRNTFQFYAVQLAQKVETRKAMERDLRTALRGEGLHLHYQPQVELGTRRILGAEALLRWRHAVRGDLLPDAFIPVAETSGLVVPLGTWVIEHACAQLAAWRKADLPPIVVAVNLSPSQCRRTDLASTVERIAGRHGCDLRFLELEVTEQIFLPLESSMSVDCLRRLQQLGVTVSIDDFGSGYSSLGRLQGLPVNKVKIDRSFVSGIGRSRDAELIVDAMITLSRSLGLAVVAEGVETEDQLQFLRAAGCHIGQGFHLAPPMPAAALAAMVGAERAVPRGPAFGRAVHPLSSVREAAWN